MVVGCHYFQPGLRPPSQSKNVTVLWPIRRYTTWWQKQIGVNNLPKVATQLSQWESNPWPNDHKSNALPLSHCTTTKPKLHHQSISHYSTNLLYIWPSIVQTAVTSKHHITSLLSVCVPAVWNSLEPDLCSIDSPGIWKSHLKITFFPTAYSRVHSHPGLLSRPFDLYKHCNVLYSTV